MLNIGVGLTESIKQPTVHISRATHISTAPRGTRESSCAPSLVGGTHLHGNKQTRNPHKSDPSPQRQVLKFIKINWVKHLKWQSKLTCALHEQCLHLQTRTVIRHNVSGLGLRVLLVSLSHQGYCVTCRMSQTFCIFHATQIRGGENKNEWWCCFPENWSIQLSFILSAVVLVVTAALSGAGRGGLISQISSVIVLLHWLNL